jgi:hypothetical protein
MSSPITKLSREQSPSFYFGDRAINPFTHKVSFRCFVLKYFLTPVAKYIICKEKFLLLVLPNKIKLKVTVPKGQAIQGRDFTNH